MPAPVLISNPEVPGGRQRGPHFIIQVCNKYQNSHHWSQYSFSDSKGTTSSINKI